MPDSTATAAPAPTQITVTTPAASVSHPSHWQAVFAAIMAILNAAEPIVVTLVSPKIANVIEESTAIADIAQQVIVQAAPAAQ